MNIHPSARTIREQRHAIARERHQGSEAGGAVIAQLYPNTGGKNSGARPRDAFPSAGASCQTIIDIDQKEPDCRIRLEPRGRYPSTLVASPSTPKSGAELSRRLKSRMQPQKLSGLRLLSRRIGEPARVDTKATTCVMCAQCVTATVHV